MKYDIIEFTAISEDIPKRYLLRCTTWFGLVARYYRASGMYEGDWYSTDHLLRNGVAYYLMTKEKAEEIIGIYQQLISKEKGRI